MLFAVAGVCALIFGSSVAIYTLRVLNRERAVYSLHLSNKESRVELLLNISSRFFGRVSVKLLKSRVVRETASKVILLLSLNNIATDLTSVVSLVAAKACLGCTLTFAVTLSLPCAISVFALVLVLVYAISNSKSDKVTSQMREQVPEALRAMVACSSTGLSLMQTLEATSRECKGALSEMFAIAARRIKMGATTSEALGSLKREEAIPELKFVAVALDIQHSAGGAITPILETARESVVSEIELLRNLRVQTSQARLSATIVTCMPFILLALFSFISSEFLKPFFTSIAGIALFVIAITMQITGISIVRKILDVSKV